MAGQVTDTTPPVLTGLTLPGVVNLSAPNPSAAFTLTATDDLTGVNSAVIFFDRAISYLDSQNTVQTASGFYLPATGNASFSLTEHLSSFASAGIYHVTEIQLQDKAGNLHSYQASDFADLGLSTTFTFTGGT